MRLLHNKTLLILLAAVLVIKIFSWQPAYVERLYTAGIYPSITKALRLLFGWIPFSIGDILYFIAFWLAIYVIVKLVRLLKRTNRKRQLIVYTGKRTLRLVLIVYLVFNILWGLNYDRLGIAYQLQLKVGKYSTGQIDTLATVLAERLNDLAAQVDTVQRNSLNNNKTLFSEGVTAYRKATASYTFLKYSPPSIKPSLYSTIGHLFGFTGYYNPFTGEAQVKTNVPVFLKPFIVTHEMAHQLGYAKENEANFVGYLGCKASTNIDFKYSVYFELFLYANGELHYKDSIKSKALKNSLHPQVLRDNQELKNYFYRTDNFVEPFISKLYDQYLKFNSQPKGKRTYNEVIAWLIAYQKKYGVESI